MTLWLVRAGKYGEREQLALEKGLVAVGWGKIPDLSGINDRPHLKKVYTDAYPNTETGTLINHVGQIWRFAKDIKKGDLVAMPLKLQAGIAVGEVVSDYQYITEYSEDYFHTRRVKWLKIIPRSEFAQDVLYSLGSVMTVGRAHAEEAEERVRSLISGKREGLHEEGAEEVSYDIEDITRTGIIKYINQHFKGHDLPRLIDAILKAQGYITKVSPPGPDGGVDILAAPGPLGFDAPKICVQVKSGSSPLDVGVFHELVGVINSVEAQQGLLVSWGGFKSSVLNEAKKKFFSIRLWDQDNLLEEIFKHYEKFSDELKAELSLKRIWVLVQKEEE